VIESCLGFLLGTTGIIVIIVFIVICCGVQQCLPKDEKPKALDSFDMNEAGIPEYPYMPPEPVTWLPRCTIPVLSQQTTGWKYYFLHCDDILWIWFPEPIETINKGQRIMASITFTAIYLLFFTSWGKRITPLASEIVTEVIPKSSPNYVRLLALRVFSGLTLASLISFIYRPILRFLTGPEPIWNHSTSKWKRAAGQILQFSGGIILFIVCLGVALSLLALLDDYPCVDFVETVIIPFFMTVLFKSTVIGFPLRYIGYRLECTWGLPPHNVTKRSTGEREALISRSDLDESMYNM